MADNGETTTPVRESKRKRVSKRPRSETPLPQAQKYEPRINFWTNQHIVTLIDHLKAHGFYGDYAAIQKMIPNISEATVKNVFLHLSRWTEPVNSEDDPENLRKKVNTPAPIEEWIAMVRDSVEVQRLGGSPSLMLEWIAQFEEHPDPIDCCGVDYKAIYLYLAALLEGHVPKQLDAPSASKLYIMFQQLVNTISQSAKTSQDLLLKTVKPPQVGTRISRDEKNKLLRERRRAVWTEEELEQARIIKSDDLDQIKKVYCDKAGLNPFSFPSSI